jgi:hypothetical protein
MLNLVWERLDKANSPTKTHSDVAVFEPWFRFVVEMSHISKSLISTIFRRTQ